VTRDEWKKAASAFRRHLRDCKHASQFESTRWASHAPQSVAVAPPGFRLRYTQETKFGWLHWDLARIVALVRKHEAELNIAPVVISERSWDCSARHNKIRRYVDAVCVAQDKILYPNAYKEIA
jgi:hypothetical protein